MATGLLLDKRLSGRTLRDSRIVVDEAACTGAKFTTLLNPDGDGKNYRLAVWSTVGSSGRLAVLVAGAAEVHIESGGGSYGLFQFDQFGQGGEGADVIRGQFILPAGLLPVTVGAAGVYNGGSGGQSKIGDLETRQPASGLGYGSGVVTRITGVPQTRALSTAYGTPAVAGVVYARWEL